MSKADQASNLDSQWLLDLISRTTVRPGDIKPDTFEYYIKHYVSRGYAIPENEAEGE